MGVGRQAATEEEQAVWQAMIGYGAVEGGHEAAGKAEAEGKAGLRVA